MRLCLHSLGAIMWKLSERFSPNISPLLPSAMTLFQTFRINCWAWRQILSLWMQKVLIDRLKAQIDITFGSQRLIHIMNEQKNIKYAYQQCCANRINQNSSNITPFYWWICFRISRIHHPSAAAWCDIRIYMAHNAIEYSLVYGGSSKGCVADGRPLDQNAFIVFYLSGNARNMQRHRSREHGSCLWCVSSLPTLIMAWLLSLALKLKIRFSSNFCKFSYFNWQRNAFCLRQRVTTSLSQYKLSRISYV